MASRSRSTSRFPRPADRPTGNARHRSRFRPSLLLLEPRTLLSTILVSNTNDGGSGSIRAAIAQAANGDQITFDPALFGGGKHQTITLTGGALNITKNLSISGPEGNLLTIDGNHNGRVMTIAVGADASLADLTLADGKTPNPNAGGAIYNQGTLKLTFCTISGNTAHAGGAIDNEYTGKMYLYGCTLSNNTATNTAGGAIDSFGLASLNQCTVADNSAYGSGGGIFTGFSLSLYDCTVSGNSARGAGINNYSGTVTLDNTIVADNVGGDVSGPVSGGGNLIGGDPMLSELGYYGGPTQTMALLPGSPAINEGNNSLIPAGTTTDQRGFPLPNQGNVDIGAFQTQPGLDVNTAADGTSLPSGQLGLRQAVALAELPNAAATVTFAPVIQGTIVLTLGALPAITSDTTIVGPGALELTIDAQHASGILSIGSGANVTITGLALSNGSASGGGAVANQGTLTLTDCTLSGNSATGGGAIKNEGTLTLTDCILSGNSAGRGGAIENQGTLTVTDCTVSGSSAIVAGGIDNSGSLTLTGGTVSGNSSKYGGGGLYNDGTGKMSLTDCTVSDNTARGGGGAIVNENGTLKLTNVNLWSNSAYDGGGIVNTGGGMVTITGCDVANNLAGGSGGGIFKPGHDHDRRRHHLGQLGRE